MEPPLQHHTSFLGNRSTKVLVGSGPEGTDDLCFHIGDISPPYPSAYFLPPPRRLYPGLKAQIPVSKLKSQSLGSNTSFEAQIPVSRLKSLS